MSSDPAAGGDLTLADESWLNKLVVRAADGTVAVGDIDVAFGSSRAAGDVLICGQRPTEWMVIGPAEAVAEFASALDTTGHVSLIDHTHARALLRITGAEVARLLEKVCSVDWSDEMTPNGAVVSASVAKVNCDIVRHDQDAIASYRIACDRSFAQYLFDALLDAGKEFGVSVGVGG